MRTRHSQENFQKISLENLASNRKRIFRIVKERHGHATVRLQRDVAIAVFLHLAGNGKAGGANRDRTGDLLLAKQALSQLSYGPVIGWWVWEELHLRPHPYQGCALTN